MTFSHSRLGSMLKISFLVALLIGISTDVSKSSAQEDAKEVAPVVEVSITSTISAQGRKEPNPVILKCDWLAGEDRDSVPIIMLHGWGGKRQEYAGLAIYLQSQGHSVLVPDLRGHGKSLERRESGKKVDRERMNKTEIGEGLIADIEACKRFLRDKNNEELCNIDALTIIAAGESCIPAIVWSVRDWSYPPIGGKKQGQDVKALVLLSPAMNFKGLTANKYLAGFPISSRTREPLSIMIGVGTRDRDGAKDARAIYNRLEGGRKKPTYTATSAKEKMLEIKRKKDLAFEQYSVSYSGTRLVDKRAKLSLGTKIGEFIHFRVDERSDNFPWQNRSIN